MQVVGRGQQGQMRNVLPAHFCSNDDCQITASKNIEHTRYDAYIFSLLPSDQIIKAVQNLKKHKKKIIWQYDDSLTEIADSNPAAKIYNTKYAQDRIAQMRELADKIIVSTETLKIKADHPDVTVLPNLLDVRLHNFKLEPKSGPVTILYTGSIHHYEDVQILYDPINAFLQNKRCDCKFVFFGYWPKSMCVSVKLPFTHYSEDFPDPKYGKEVELIDGVPLHKYPSQLHRINADISLCSLDPTLEFNKSKSNLKYMECGMYSSDVWTNFPLVYPEAKHKQDWFAEIVDLTTNQIREMTAEDGRSTRVNVVKNWTWQFATDKKQQWIDFFNFC